MVLYAVAGARPGQGHVTGPAGRRWQDHPMRVVLLHGFTQGPGSWASLAERLVASGHEVVTPTLPGHGGAGAVEGSFEQEAAALAETVGGPPAVWVGYSLGGRLAVRIALERPDLVERPGAARGHRRSGRPRRAGGPGEAGRDPGLGAGTQGPGPVPHRMAQPGPLQTPPGRGGRARRAKEQHRRGARLGPAPARDRRSGTPVGPPQRAAHAGARHGRRARQHLLSLAFRLAAGIGGDQTGVSFVPGAGHAAHLERPESFALLLERFLDR